MHFTLVERVHKNDYIRHTEAWCISVGWACTKRMYSQVYARPRQLQDHFLCEQCWCILVPRLGLSVTTWTTACYLVHGQVARTLCM